VGKCDVEIEMMYRNQRFRLYMRLNLGIVRKPHYSVSYKVGFQHILWANS